MPVRNRAGQRTAGAGVLSVVLISALVLAAPSARTEEDRPKAATLEDLFGPTGNKFAGSIGFMVREANAVPEAIVGYEGAKVAVFLTDPNLQQPISVDNLVSVYGLTPSEAQVAITLANGHNIDEIAKTSNHSAHTIRSQLKSVFRKTGVSRQSELIKLLLTGPFAQRRRSSEP